MSQSQKRQFQSNQKHAVTVVQKEHEWTILFTEEMETVNQSCEKRKCNKKKMYSTQHMSECGRCIEAR